MKDKFGNELHIGDEVYYAQNLSTAYDIGRGTIVKFTPKRIVIKGTYGFETNQIIHKGYHLVGKVVVK